MNIVRKAVKILGIMAILVVAGGVIFLVLGYQYDRSSKQFVSTLAHQVFNDWNQKEFEKYCGEEVYQISTPEQIKKYFITVKKKLGPFKKTDDPQGESSIVIVPKTVPDRVVASYYFYSDYEKATARIQVTLAWRNKTWKVIGIKVISDALLK